MATIRYLCRGLIGLVVLVAVFLANATSSHGRTDNSTMLRIPSTNHPKVDKLPITAASKFDLLSNLKKGDTHSGLTDLKKFLGTFGYLPPPQYSPPTALFDDHLEAALRLYQRSFNLSATGVLDRATLDVLRVPRCGREDVRDGLPLMLLPRANRRSSRNGRRLPPPLEGQQWKILGGNKKWETTRNLTYAFSSLPESNILTNKDIRSAVGSAFQSWAAVVPIDFHETNDFEGANIKIEFLDGDHADGFPFDGRMGVLSHAFAPEDGRFHLDSAELWTVSMAITDDRSAMDVETVAVHEIGHLIGLDHSSVNGSVMFPSLESRKVKRELTDDDIDGATALYGPRTFRQNSESPHRTADEEFKKHHPGYQRLPNSSNTRLDWALFVFVFRECFLPAVCWIILCWF